jgi:hypothetical protein
MRYQVIGGSVVALAVLGGWGVIANAQQDPRATEILAAARKAIGDKKLEGLKTLSVEATLQRNAGNFQSQAEVEMAIEMPDKYVRSDAQSGAMNFTMTTGFNGDKAITPPNMRALPGGGIVFSMGVGGAAHPEGEKPTPEQLEQLNKSQLRNSRTEISRLMLGWFGAAHPALKVQYSYAGEAESPDGKAYVIDVKDEDGFAARLFIDQNSKLPLMVTYQGRQRQMIGGPAGAGAPRITSAGGGEQRTPTRQLTEEEMKQLRERQGAAVTNLAAQAPMVEYSLFFDDWREVDGINFPHVMRRASKGATEEEWTIRKIKVNPKLDPKKFAIENK